MVTVYNFGTIELFPTMGQSEVLLFQNKIYFSRVLRDILDFDDCVNVTCHNDGSCSDGVNIYSCICLAGYTGLNCETGLYSRDCWIRVN